MAMDKLSAILQNKEGWRRSLENLTVLYTLSAFWVGGETEALMSLQETMKYFKTYSWIMAVNLHQNS